MGAKKHIQVAGVERSETRMIGDTCNHGRLAASTITPLPRLRGRGRGRGMLRLLRRAA
jgi:hypothetical protein